MTQNVQETVPDDERPKSFVGCSGTPGQGPHMVIVLTIAAEMIVQARFSTYGCPAAIACGQFICDTVENKSYTDATNVDVTTIVNGVGRMPLGREHCPALAVDALADALSRYRSAITDRLGVEITEYQPEH